MYVKAKAKTHALNAESFKMTDRPTREDALAILDAKQERLKLNGAATLTLTEFNTIRAYIENTPYEPLAVEQSAEEAKEQPVKVGRGSSIVIDRDKEPMGLVTLMDLELLKRLDVAQAYINTNPEKDSARTKAFEVLWEAANRFKTITAALLAEKSEG